MSTTATTPATKQKINLAEIAVGDVFSEESHYRLLGITPQGQYQFTHIESEKTINLDAKYVEDLLVGADQYSQEVLVGKEDKLWTAKQIADAKQKGELDKESKVREGDVRIPGIRSIWAGIYSSKVVQVSFTKQDKAVSAKALQAARDKQLSDIIEKVNLNNQVPYNGPGRPRKDGTKKLVAATLSPAQFEEVIKEVQANPILDYVPGEERILRGYKTQFSSITGQYDVIDMDITTGSPVRQVNVNQINWLVTDGIKYVVK